MTCSRNMKSIFFIPFLFFSSSCHASLIDVISTPFIISSFPEFKSFIAFQTTKIEIRTKINSHSTKTLLNTISSFLNKITEDINQIETHSLSKHFDKENKPQFLTLANKIVESTTLPFTSLLDLTKDKTTTFDSQEKLSQIALQWTDLQTTLYYHHSKQIPITFYPLILNFKADAGKKYKHAMRLFTSIGKVYPGFSSKSQVFLFKHYQFLVQKMSFVMDLSLEAYEIRNSRLRGDVVLELLQGISELYKEMYDYFEKYLRVAVIAIENGVETVEGVHIFMSGRLKDWDWNEDLLKKLLIRKEEIKMISI